MTRGHGQCARTGPNHFMQIQGDGQSIWRLTFWSMRIFNFYCQKQVKQRDFLNDDGLIILYYFLPIPLGIVPTPRPLYSTGCSTRAFSHHIPFYCKICFSRSFSVPLAMAEAELYMQYRGVLVPSAVHTPQSLKYYEEFTFRPDDIIVATYPKSGTTWMQEIVPLIVSGGDPASVETLPNWDRVPWLEEKQTCNLNLEERPSPRMCTTHFLYNMMPPSFFKVKPKVIYVMRNPRDVFTSLFHYHGMAAFLSNPGTQNEFLHEFLDGKVMFGSWFDHVKSWLNAEDKEHIMYISYEEMIMDLKDSVARIAQFLQKSLNAEMIEKVADQCLFKNMKKNNMSNYSFVPREIMDQTKSEFLRKGIAGDWKNQLTAAEAEYFDAVYKDKMKDVKYKFVWD